MCSRGPARAAPGAGRSPPGAPPAGGSPPTARFRAAAINVSMFAIVTRTDTPERCDTSDDRRASCDSSATTSCMNTGT